MSTSKIRDGLDTRARAKSGGTFNLANLTGAPASVTDLNALATKATAKRDRLKVLAESISISIAKFTDAKTAEYAELGRIRDGNLITDTLGENQRRTMVEREISKFARNARKVSADERSRLLSELRDITGKIAAVRESWSDPVAILMRRTLADPKRGVYAANLANAGPVAVENALRDAVIGGNAALAAAALDRLSAMPASQSKSVRFSKRDVAESLVAEEWTKARAFIAMTDIAEAESDLANSQAEGGRDSATLKMRVGILRKELAALVPESTPAPDNKNKPKGDLLSDDEWQRNLNAKFPAVPVPEGTVIIGRESST
jgi:hypothetical protein